MKNYKMSNALKMFCFLLLIAKILANPCIYFLTVQIHMNIFFEKFSKIYSAESATLGINGYLVYGISGKK
jgi:hypothetical protein